MYIHETIDYIPRLSRASHNDVEFGQASEAGSSVGAAPAAASCTFALVDMPTATLSTTAIYRRFRDCAEFAQPASAWVSDCSDERS